MLPGDSRVDLKLSDRFAVDPLALKGRGGIHVRKCSGRRIIRVIAEKKHTGIPFFNPRETQTASRAEHKFAALVKQVIMYQLRSCYILPALVRHNIPFLIKKIYFFCTHSINIILVRCNTVKVIFSHKL